MPSSPRVPKSNAADTPNWGVSSRVTRDLSGATLGDYRVEQLLGRGGMGEVYLARQLSLDRLVALKVLRPDLLEHPTSLARFEAEAWAAAKLNHPNIVHIYAFGHVDEIRYIAMEYVRGTNLREYLGRKTKLDLPVALSIMKQAGMAVEAAGEVGLIHRDLKPENLLLTRKGLAKVADFGLCRDHGNARVDLTQTGMTLGTPLYMSPEQVQGKPLDPRSDLYSLGVTFYHMLAGRPPFEADSALALAMKHIHERPTSLADHRPDLPSGVVDLVMKLLAKDPADRHASATEMLRDLARARESSRAAAGPASPSIGDADALPFIAVAEESLRGLPVARSEGRPKVEKAPRAEPAPFPRRTLAAALAIGLIAGVAGAWISRGEDLLADGAPSPVGPPGLWIAPAWETRVHRRDDAEAQYRLAQLQASDEGREAAWLAVPGRFPRDATWAGRAYLQLGRHLLRIGDRDALGGLASDLARAGRDEDADLAKVLRAGVAALDGDTSAVRDALDRTPGAAKPWPPALAELAWEVVRVARARPRDAASKAVDLAPIAHKFHRALKFNPRDAEPSPRPG